jgi:hypothetical protein
MIIPGTSYALMFDDGIEQFICEYGTFDNLIMNTKVSHNFLYSSEKSAKIKLTQFQKKILNPFYQKNGIFIKGLNKRFYMSNVLPNNVHPDYIDDKFYNTLNYKIALVSLEVK